MSLVLLLPDQKGNQILRFVISARDISSHARCGKLETAHGTFDTPVFMPVGTQGTVKSLIPEELEQLGAQVILGNTYHLYLRPGADRIERLGGLHRFMGWQGSILTDSGGFQVFSLAKISKIEEEGVVFQSHIDGSRHMISPEIAVDIQEKLGSDIAMVFDECTPFPSSREYVARSVERTVRWASRCRQAHRREDQALFGIVQGGVFPDIRKNCLESLLETGFEGYALGSLSVGESKEQMLDILREMAPLLPEFSPRYVMGVGTPEDLVEGVASGVDMFDCVMPTRNARNGMLFTSWGSIQIKNSQYADDPDPIESGCQCYTCQRFSRAYLRHLFIAHELLSYRLNTIHNLHQYQTLMREMRYAISINQFAQWRSEFYSRRGPVPRSATQ